MSKDNFNFFKNVVEAIVFSSSQPVKIDILEKRVPTSIDLDEILTPRIFSISALVTG